MREVYFNLHNVVRIRLVRPSWFPFGAMVERLYASYRTTALLHPNLIIRFRDFTPDTTGTVRIENYQLKKNYLFGRFSHKGAQWRVQMRGFGTRHMTVDVACNLLGMVGFASITFNVLIKLMFFMEGFIPVHSVCLEKNGRACLFTARSGVGKTLFALHMAKRGYRLMGDDEVFLKGDKVVSNLIPINFKFVYS